MKAKSNNVSQPESQPIYWFAILEMSRSRGDIQNAARAQRVLGQMGVSVIYECLGHREVASF